MTIHAATKVSEEVNGKLSVRNMMVQLLALYHRPCAPQWTALLTDRQTDRRHYDGNSRSYCVTVRSVKIGSAKLFYVNLYSSSQIDSKKTRKHIQI